MNLLQSPLLLPNRTLAPLTLLPMSLLQSPLLLPNRTLAPLKFPSKRPWLPIGSLLASLLGAGRYHAVMCATMALYQPTFRGFGPSGPDLRALTDKVEIPNPNPSPNPDLRSLTEKVENPTPLPNPWPTPDLLTFIFFSLRQNTTPPPPHPHTYSWPCWR